MNNDELPNDATGDALRRLRDDGANLRKSHDIDFYVAIPSKSAAEYVSHAVSQLGFAASVSEDEEGSDWTCCCTKSMVPDHAAINDIETMLDSIAEQVGGKADGWGAFSVN